MQFARPAAPRPAWFDLPSLLARDGRLAGRTGASSAASASRSAVRPDRLSAFADAEQVRTALTCLLRNAVEAAPADGWARVRVVEPLAGSR